MVLRAWSAAVVVGSLALCCAAQTTRPRVSLRLGSVDVWLGMPREEATDLFVKAGLRKTSELKDGRINFESHDGHEYQVQFDNGRLGYASREWYFPQTDLDVFQSTMAALAAIKEGGNTSDSCSIRAPTRKSPRRRG